MGPTSDDLRQDIDLKREELGAHVVELGDHVAPGRVAQRRWRRVRSSLPGTPESGTDTPSGSSPVIIAASFIAGLVLGIWFTRRRYLAKLAALDT